MAATVSLTPRPAVPFPYFSLETLEMGLIPSLVFELFLCGSHKYGLGLLNVYIYIYRGMTLCVLILSTCSQHMDPTEREKAGFKTRQTNLAKPPSNLEATVFVQNVS